MPTVIYKNQYDDHVLLKVIEQSSWLIDKTPEVGIYVRGYCSTSQIGETRIEISKLPGKRTSLISNRKPEHYRAGIEIVKTDYRLARNFPEGSIIGDSLNLMLAAAVFNFNKFMKEFSSFLFDFKRTFCSSWNN